MRKIVLGLVLALLLSSNAYAKLVKLNCSFRDAYFGGQKLTPDMEFYQIVSRDDVISFNDNLKIFAGMKADKFDEEIIKLTMYDEIKGPKATVDMKKVWTVNRVTGVFTKEIYTKIPGRDTSWSSANTYRYDCRKAKKKF